MKDWSLSENSFDVIVIGAGHAGCEAALVSSRMGVKTVLLTLNSDSVAMMACNPSIGGPGKGHLVRELACFGGQMPRTIDQTLIQLRLLNESRGAAVRSLRAQADKHHYSFQMKRALELEPNLQLRQCEVIALLVDGQNRVKGVRTQNHQLLYAPKVVICTGVYLKSRIIVGDTWFYGGPSNQRASLFLSDSLREHGFELFRLQTATPPRILKSSINFTGLKKLSGDEKLRGFSFPERVFPNQLDCYLSETNQTTMKVVRDNLHHSPLKMGNITDAGPKHCPSIDRKLINFPHMNVHHIFFEPEGRDSGEVYLQGLTTALPASVQEKLVHSVAGLEKAHILRYGYAIEYDTLKSTQMKLSLESHNISGLYAAGQINGTSGYEEAAVQGFVAGLNAALAIKGEDPFIPSRTESYTGVLIEDLVSREWRDPYRMIPSRVEFRLQLRMGNAISRLMHYGLRWGLLKEDDCEVALKRVASVKKELLFLKENSIHPDKKTLLRLSKAGEQPIRKSHSLFQILTRPTMSYEKLKRTFTDFNLSLLSEYDYELLQEEVKYDGYVKRQKTMFDQVKKYDFLTFPQPLNMKNLPEGISSEVISQLKELQPYHLGQFMRRYSLSLDRGDLARLYDYLIHLNKTEPASPMVPDDSSDGIDS